MVGILNQAEKRLREMEAELRALPGLGPRAAFTVSLFNTGPYFNFQYVEYAQSKPGQSNGCSLVRKPGEDIEEAYERFKGQVVDWLVTREHDRVNALALLLIKYGPQTPAAKLRQEGFSDEELVKWAKEAAELADVMADNKPFGIVFEEGGSNGAPEVELEDDDLLF